MRKITITILLLFCSASFAQNNQEPNQHSVQNVVSSSSVKLVTWNDIILSKWFSIDKDKNNLLSISELGSISFVFRILSFKYFNEIDLNHDDFISKDELLKFSNLQEKNQTEKINNKWHELDTNHDGFISRDEASFDKNTKEHFGEIDLNHDEKVDINEFINVYNDTLLKKLNLK